MDEAIQLSRKQHTAALTDEVWSELQRRAVMEGKSASDLCEYVLADYVQPDNSHLVYAMPWADLPKDQYPPQFRLDLRSFYILDAIWAEIRVLKIIQRRPINEILEQQLRLYLNLDLGDLVKP
jgi:hypothetical protein